MFPNTQPALRGKGGEGGKRRKGKQKGEVEGGRGGKKGI